jgi:acyl-CoA thioester hydrolase
MEFEIPVRVYYQDTDAGGVMFHATYLNYLERARVEWMRARGCDATQLVNRFGIIFIVRQLEIFYLKPALLDDLVMVSAAVEKMGRAQLTFAQQIRRNGETLVRAGVNVACVSANRLKPAAFPEEIQATLAGAADPAQTEITRAGQPRRHLNHV